MRCQSCKYDLSRLTEPRCPECGREFDPNDPGTYFVPRINWARVRRDTVIQMILSFVILFALCYRAERSMQRWESQPDTARQSVIVAAAVAGVATLLLSPFLVMGNAVASTWRVL